MEVSLHPARQRPELADNVNETSRSYKAGLFRGGKLRVLKKQLHIASWNVEGLTDAKIFELQKHMWEMGIDILCIQDTHCSQSPYYLTEEGYLVILSGSEDESDHQYAGVGFLIAPDIRRSVIGFLQASPRYASLKIRVSGGKLVITSAYSPHSGKPYTDRQAFYDELSAHIANQSFHGFQMVLGDFNARLHRAFPGEEEILGPYVFGNPQSLNLVQNPIDPCLLIYAHPKG